MRSITIGLLCLTITLSFTEASAATFTVTKTADTADGTCNDDCSLREAVIAANASPGADEIIIPSGFYLLTLMTPGEDAAATGDLDITEDVTVTGDGSESTVIDGGKVLLAAPDRVFDVLQGSADFSGITVQNGRQAASGGGIRMQGAGSLTLTDCRILHNEGSFAGGVQYSATGAVTIRNSFIDDNVGVSNMGGVLIENGTDVDIESTSISRNQAVNGFAGGLLSRPTGTTTIADSFLDDNIAQDQAGGLLTQSGTDVTITGTSVSRNTSQGSFAGGFLNQNAGTTTIADSFFDDNISAAQGGGAMIQSGTDTTITNTSLSRNRCTDFGGGLLEENSGTLTLTDCTIDDNVSANNAAGIQHDAGASFVLNGGSVRNNKADLNGGGLVNSFGTLSISGAIIDGNIAVDGSGGGIDHTGSGMDVSGSSITNNTALNRGGGIYDQSAAPFTMVNVTLAGNIAGQGGAVAHGAAAVFRNVTIAGNASVDGGGIYMPGGTTKLKNSIVAGNSLGGDCSLAVPFTSEGYNIVGDGTCGATDPTDHPSTDPQLGPLADNGGGFLTLQPLTGSPAIDGGDPAGCTAADDSALTEDERGFARPTDGNSDGTAVCDIGALEVSFCGDGVVQTDEECDDGNTADGDGCSASCSTEASGATGGTTGGTATGGTTGGSGGKGGGCSLVR